MSKRATQIITVFEDGTIHIQNLTEATTFNLTEEGDTGLDEGGGNNPPPPKDP